MAPDHNSETQEDDAVKIISVMNQLLLTFEAHSVEPGYFLVRESDWLAAYGKSAMHELESDGIVGRHFYRGIPIVFSELGRAALVAIKPKSSVQP